MTDDDTWIRPRTQAWGNEAQRAVLHAIAEDVARRSGHKVVAIEALRSDGFLEFVAIAGDADANAQMIGQASPLSLDQILGLGIEMDGWVHIPSERLDDDARAWLAEYGHRPDVPASAVPHGWNPDDQLVRLLKNEEGELRGLLYLDEPLSGLRPTPESVAAMNAEVEVMCDAVVSMVERELYGEQVRMLTQARSAMQGVRADLGFDDFLQEMCDAMVAAMSVDAVDVLLAGHLGPDLAAHTVLLEEHMRQVWLRRGHLVVEQEQTWGVGERAVATPDALRRLMKSRSLGSWLLVPIGIGEDYLGTLGLGRTHGGPRWIDSEINAAAAVASDVARLVLDARLMERERALHAELRDISDYRHTMVNTLAHELRNPVTVLWTHLDLLGQDPHSGPVTDSLAAMDRAARRIEDMIEDMMALARVSDPDRAAPLTPVDLSRLVTECCEFMAPVALRSGLEVVRSLDDDLTVAGDEAGLQRLVSNLLSNALKYSPSGGTVTLSLTPETVAGRDGVRLTCADEGIGISASEIEHLFTPFFRSSSPQARERPGTGLGLAITERVVTWHQGTIEVHSELGAGTTFTVWLPSAPPAALP